MKAYFVDRVGALDKVERTPQGGARVSAALARTGVLPYSTAVMRKDPNNKVPREYLNPVARIYTPPEVLVTALDTLREAPVTREHPKKMVCPQTFKDVSRGLVSGSDVAFDGSHIRGTLVIQDADLLDDIEHNVRREVSMGYFSSYDFEPGVTPEGEAYDAIRRDIFYNHAAVVTSGRAGSSVCLALDSDEIILEDVVALKIKGKEVAVDAAQAAIDGLEGELTGKTAELDTAKNKISELETKLAKATSQETKDSWLAERDALETQKKAKADKVAKIKAAGVAIADDASDAFIEGVLAGISADPDGLKALKGVSTSTDAKDKPAEKKVKFDARANFMVESRKLPPIEG